MTASELPPLHGLRVIDLSRVLAGPWATQTLADLGADVIKVERPGKGDDARVFGPPFLGPEGDAHSFTPMFLAANRGKRSLSLDIQSPEGLEIVKKLVADADVLVENFMVGRLAKLGLDIDTLHAINPGLIVCSISGYGQTGPYADRGGLDPIIQAMSGMMSQTGHPPGMPGAGPMKTGPHLVDIFTGIYAVVAIQAALAGRAKSGKGAHVDISLLDCGMQMVAQQAIIAQINGTSPPAPGNNSNAGVPGGGYQCADGYIVIAVGNEGAFKRLCQAIGMPDLSTDPRFASNAARVANREVVLETFLPVFASLKVDDLVDMLRANNIPATRVNDMIEALADEQVRERGLIVQLPIGSTPAPQIAGAIVIDGQRLSSSKAPPKIGEDGAELLSELGYSREAQADLRARKII